MDKINSGCLDRPTGLPSIDARTPETIKKSKFLVSGIEGMVDTPTPEQQKSIDDSIDRKLKLIRNQNEY